MKAPKLEMLEPGDQKVLKIIQSEAQKLNKVFFFESADGPELEIDDLCLFCADGWLVPNKEAEEFKKIYENNFDLLVQDDPIKWDQYAISAEWEQTENGFKYYFVSYLEMF